MGQIILPATGSIYVDTSAFIYFVEKIEPYFSSTRPLWDAVSAGTREVLTSELTLLETLVKPIQLGNTALADLYRNVLLNTIGINSIPINRSVLESASSLRATMRLSTPDAIHAATAMATRATCVVTNDPAFRRVASLHVVVVSES